MRPADLVSPIAIGVIVLLGWATIALQNPWWWIMALGGGLLAALVTWIYGRTLYRHGILDEMVRDRHVEPDEDTPADGFA